MRYFHVIPGSWLLPFMVKTKSARTQPDLSRATPIITSQQGSRKSFDTGMMGECESNEQGGSASRKENPKIQRRMWSGIHCKLNFPLRFICQLLACEILFISVSTDTLFAAQKLEYVKATCFASFHLTTLPKSSRFEQSSNCTCV